MKSIAIGSLFGLMGLLLIPDQTFAFYVGENKDSSSYYYGLGQKEYNARKYSNAWRYLEKAGNFNPNDAAIQKNIAEVCLKMNKMAPAIKALEQAYKIDPADNETLARLTKLYFDYSQWDKVLEFAGKLKQKSSSEKGLSFMMGKANYMREDYGKAMTQLQAAIKEDPKNAEANYLIGRSLVVMSNYRNAVPYYEQALALDTTQPNRYYELAMVLATAEQFDKSVVWFQRALDRGYKARDDFYMNMAYTLADAKKIDQAVKMLNDILERRPQDISLMYGIADVCYHSGRYKQAISYWDRVLEQDNKNAHALYKIGLSYIKMGKNEDGTKLCDQAIAMDPSLGVLKHKREMQ